ncbi:non-homologous end-joining DNA ligase [Actinophytocola oryzae]|uniref:Bifunctional non-homologous end joining protein LigD n=1 Tax=Actinophytocola oryzae TaxID=502181 RepID=A0A4R7V3A6_9PSEU|nr:non-homologous end-joining DNA ligase [Actinophytocola oryzae]TDV43092.1 bifunctional non-homologous end joining protein LigD [Actinophytocola oryzae]
MAHDGRQAATTEHDIELSNPDKVLYPGEGLTKGDVAEYYRAVADAMLPHLAGRPLVLHRFPDGVNTKGFVQQDIGDHAPDWVRTADLPRRGREGTVRHVVCEDADTLVYLANQAALELHAWPSRVDRPEHPDRLVVDLDPPEGTDVATLRTIARQVRDLYREVGLEPFVQATGSRGFHVVAPLDHGADYEFVRELAADLADQLAAAHPDALTTAHRKQKRGDRVYLDVDRNAYGQTFVVPYSLRARPGAPAAAPLDWAELGRATPAGHTIHTMAKRLSRKQDPWSSMGAGASPRDVRAALDALR